MLWRPLGDGEEDGGRGWSMGFPYPHSLGESQRKHKSVFCEAFFVHAEAWEPHSFYHTKIALDVFIFLVLKKRYFSCSITGESPVWVYKGWIDRSNLDRTENRCVRDFQ